MLSLKRCTQSFKTFRNSRYCCCTVLYFAVWSFQITQRDVTRGDTMWAGWKLTLHLTSFSRRCYYSPLTGNDTWPVKLHYSNDLEWLSSRSSIPDLIRRDFCCSIWQDFSRRSPLSRPFASCWQYLLTGLDLTYIKWHNSSH